MREPQYNILADVQDAIERAKQGKLALYWQRAIQREYHCKKVTPAEQQAYEQLQSILSEVPQWSDEEELRSGMEEIGGRVWFCHFWIDHNSMVQLTEDRNGGFHAAYVLDADASPEVRREAALLAQKELAKCMQEWGISLLNAPVPEQIEVLLLWQKPLLTLCKFSMTRKASPGKKRPAGCAACIGKCRSKGLGALPNKHFATQNKQMYIRLHCLPQQCVPFGSQSE